MSDGVLAWAKRQRDEWDRVLPLYQIRKLQTREGDRDTTQETVDDLRVRRLELDILIIKHENGLA